MHWIARIAYTFCLLSLMTFAIPNVMAGSNQPTQQAASQMPPLLITPPVTLDAATWQIQPQRSNMSTIPFKDCYEGKYRGVLQKMEADPSVPFYAEYDWQPAKTSRYAIFVATTRQGVAFTSPMHYQFNGQSKQPVPAPSQGTPQWGPGKAMSWTCLGEFDLEKDKPVTLRLESSQRRVMDTHMAMYVNGFFAIDMNKPMQNITIEQASFNKSSISAGKTLTVELKISMAVSQLQCALNRRGEMLLPVTATPCDDQRTLRATWSLPSDLPSDDYQLQFMPQFGMHLKTDTLPNVHIDGIAPTTASTNPLQIQSIDWQDNKQTSVVIKLNQPAPTDTLIGLWLHDQNTLLHATFESTIKQGQSQTIITLPTTPRWQQVSTGKLTIFIHGQNNAKSHTLACKHQATQTPEKPLANGIYREDAGNEHRWYVRDDHMLIWDGKPWVPVGGMFCSPVLTFPTMDESIRKAKWDAHHKSLDDGLKAGLKTLYVNLGHGPMWQKQAVINDFNQRNLPYGWQLGFRVPMPVYPIRSNTKQGLISGKVDEAGQLTINLPRQNIHELILVGPAKNPKVHRIELQMNLDAGHKPDFIQLDLTEDSASGQLTAVKLKRDELEPGEYYGLAQVTRREHFTNLWDRMDDFIEHYQWLKQINWGPNLRLFIDPSGNEEGLFNQSESVRVRSDNFDQWYATWLKQRYQTNDALADAWSLKASEISDWQQAARLLPIHDLNHDTFAKHTWWIDPVTQKVLVTQDKLGQGWDDYCDAVRISYAIQRDRLAMEIKKIVNVPIVFKRVSPWVNIETVNRIPGGFDGVGLELYPAWGSVVSPGLATGAAEARMASQTMWLLGTEMGYSAASGNKGVKGWPNREYVENFVRTTAAFGAKGFFFFGWRLEPHHMWGNSNLDALPEQVQWLTDTIDPLMQNWPAAVPLAQSYPQGHAWYFRVAGQPLTRDTAMYPNASSSIIQSIMLQPDSHEHWAVSSNLPIPDADPIVVNLQDTHAVKRFGPQIDQWLKAGKHIIYVGLWPEGTNRDCSLAKHFNTVVLKDDKGQYQNLRIANGDQILASDEQDKPWAKLSGRTLVIARPIAPVANRDVVPEPIDPKWVEQLLKR
jgi:hypothetical protein